VEPRLHIIYSKIKKMLYHLCSTPW